MRAVVVTGALLALLAAVAVGSRSEGWRGGSVREVSPVAVDLAYTFAVIFVIAMLVVIVLTIRGAKGKVSLERPEGLARVFVVLALFAAIGAYGLSRFEFQREQQEENDEVFGTAPTLTEVGDARTPRRPRQPEFQWWLVVVVGGIAAGGAYWWYRRLRSERPVREPVTVEQELTQVLSQTLDDLALEADPRRAVIRAYARMEQVLAHNGLPREPHEAPLEYLARVLRELRVRPEAAHALTELFERAKFSQHEIDAAMKDEAIAALRTVRDDLEAAA